MKIWLRANFSSNIFRLIQQNFHVGLVYSLFHPTFHSYDVIWNVSTSNFKWFNKIKALCKTVTIKKSLNKAKMEMNKATKKILTIYLNYKNKVEKNTKMEQKKLKIGEKEKTSRPKKVYKRNRKKERLRKLTRSRVLPRRGFSSSEFTSSDSITGKNMSVAIFDLTLNERMDGLACEWNILDDTHKRYKLSSNILPTFTQNFIQHVG